ncbi:MAG: peptide deformylase [Candidatus Buchananbacteria bacterium]
MLKIITLPNPILRQTAKELTAAEINSAAIQQLIKEMVPAMIKADGVGLAAPQVAQSVSLVVINRQHLDQTAEPLILLNPKITKKSFRKVVGEEGCLSVPGYLGLVSRHKIITVKYLDPAGQPQKLTVKDLFARVVQHELDHLAGILYIDKAKKLFKLDHEQL